MTTVAVEPDATQLLVAVGRPLKAVALGFASTFKRTSCPALLLLTTAWNFRDASFVVPPAAIVEPFRRAWSSDPTVGVVFDARFTATSVAVSALPPNDDQTDAFPRRSTARARQWKFPLPSQARRILARVPEATHPLSAV